MTDIDDRLGHWERTGTVGSMRVDTANWRRVPQVGEFLRSIPGDNWYRVDSVRPVRTRAAGEPVRAYHLRVMRLGRGRPAQAGPDAKVNEFHWHGRAGSRPGCPYC